VSVVSLLYITVSNLTRWMLCSSFLGEFEGKETAVKQLTKQKDDSEFSKAFHEFRREVYAMRYVLCLRSHII
jgi:hypothetical protein